MRIAHSGAPNTFSSVLLRALRGASVGTMPPDDAVDFRTLFESAPALYLVLDPELRILAVTDAYLQATMSRREALVGKSILDVLPQLDVAGIESLRASLARVKTTLERDGVTLEQRDATASEMRHWSFASFPVLERPGCLRYILHALDDVTALVLLQGKAHGLDARVAQLDANGVLHARDLFEANGRLQVVRAALDTQARVRSSEVSEANEALRRSEEQLRQAQKMEAVGRLAGGIAHDFNNLLSVILSVTDLLREGAGGSEPLTSDLAEISKAASRAADLTRHLLAFSRQQVLDLRVLDLNEVLSSVGKLLERLIGADVELRVLPGPHLGRVKADPGQLEQVILNLAVNARDAMPHGGKLTIETWNVHLGESYAAQHLDVAPGPYVMLVVSDTGVGMDKATQARIFDPFFTTKEVGKGTGLGLATVFGIVRQLGGSIWVYSEVGFGTAFKAYLPAIEGDLTWGPSSPPPARAIEYRGTETILLVEDEAQVRAVATAILRRSGYTVLDAPNPAAALRILLGHSGPIDLLLSDIIMPKMNGRELAARVSAVRPEVRTLFMSGYTADVIVHHGVLDAGMAYLQKPFTPESLTRKVHGMLHA